MKERTHHDRKRKSVVKGASENESYGIIELLRVLNRPVMCLESFAGAKATLMKKIVIARLLLSIGK